MLRHEGMQKVVMGTLAVMMVASLLLAVAALSAPQPVAARGGPQPRWTNCTFIGCWGSCNNGWGVYKHLWCYSEGKGWYPVDLCVDDCP